MQRMAFGQELSVERVVCGECKDEEEQVEEEAEVESWNRGLLGDVL